MTRDDVDALFGRADKALPAHPDWRDGTQIGTVRAYLPVSLEGRSTGLQVAIVVRPSKADYLVANLLANRSCIARLCLSGGHRDRATRALILGGHMHRWQDNRPSGQKIAKAPKLPKHVVLPPSIATRDDAFQLFLRECGIESPHWWPMVWPRDLVLL